MEQVNDRCDEWCGASQLILPVWYEFAIAMNGVVQLMLDLALRYVSYH